jgi:F-type H+-transporting ATPase subunit b
MRFIVNSTRTKSGERDRRSSRAIGRSLRIALLAVGTLALSQGLALAAGGGGEGDHGSEMKTFGWQAVNLVILVGVLVYVGRKPIVAFFSERREQIQGDLAAAAQLLTDAEARNSELQRRLVDLESEVEEIREIARRRAEEESERILAEARKAAERIRSDATAAVDQELRRAQQELRDEAANLALDLAGDLLRDQISDTDRDRLIDEFIVRVEPTPA